MGADANPPAEPVTQAAAPERSPTTAARRRRLRLAILLACVVAVVPPSGLAQETTDQSLEPPRALQVQVRDAVVDSAGTFTGQFYFNFTESTSADVDDYRVWARPGVDVYPDRSVATGATPIASRPGWLTMSAFMTFSAGNWTSELYLSALSVNNTTPAIGFESCRVLIIMANATDDEALCGYRIRPPEFFAATIASFPDSAFDGEAGARDVTWFWTVSPDDPDPGNGTGFDYYLVARELTGEGGEDSGRLRYYGPLPSSGLDGGGRRVANITGMGQDYLLKTDWTMLARDPDLGIWSASACSIVFDRAFVQPDSYFETLTWTVGSASGAIEPVPRSTPWKYCVDPAFAPNEIRDALDADLGLLDPSGPRFPLVDVDAMQTATGLTSGQLGAMFAVVVVGGAGAGGVLVGGLAAGVVFAAAGLVVAGLLGLIPIWVLVLAFALGAFLLIDPIGMRGSRS